MRTETLATWLLLVAMPLTACATQKAVDCTTPPEVLQEQLGSLSYCELPADMRAFASRHGMCNHFLGEEPYDAERAAYLQRMYQETCNGLDAERTRLLRKHQQTPALRALLERHDPIGP